MGGGGYCFLKHKDGKKSLMNSINLTMDDLDYVDEIQMNGLHVDYEYSRHTLQLGEFALNVERCQNFREFLLLTKLDFLKNVT